VSVAGGGGLDETRPESPWNGPAGLAGVQGAGGVREAGSVALRARYRPRVRPRGAPTGPASLRACAPRLRHGRGYASPHGRL